MIDLEQIKGYFPAELTSNITFQKYVVKEYIQLMILDFLSTSPYIQKITFIGGTNLRLIKGINRFSEDLDFDCKNLSQEDFTKMTDEILTFLHRSGLKVETRDKDNCRLTAFRRNYFFPELLFNFGLSGYREERFMIKVESQDQKVEYQPKIVNVKRAGFFFPFPVPSDPILCAMKLSALLTRQKGRDFYDAMFLLGQTEPDYQYLATKRGIHNREELKEQLIKTTEATNLNMKYRDFEHLLFNKADAIKVLRFGEFVKEL